VLKVNSPIPPIIPTKQGLPEDKEIARQAIVEESHLLKTRFPGLQKDERSRTTSLLSVPFGSGKMIGAVNLFTANGRRNFDEKICNFFLSLPITPPLPCKTNIF
jgi:uncharacterized protein affecting Mg2+/Co2+ transport